MSIQTSKFPLSRRFLALGLALLMAGMPTFSLRGAAPIELPDYERMTLNQLKAEYHNIQDQISRHNKWMREQEWLIFGDRNNEYLNRYLDIDMKIGDLEAKIKTKDIAINRELASVEIRQREMDSETRKRILDHEMEKTQLQNELRAERQRSRQVRNQWHAWKDSIAPRFRAMMAQYEQWSLPLNGLKEKILEAGSRRFPDYELFRSYLLSKTKPSSSQNISLPIDPGELDPSIPKDDPVRFLRDLKEPLSNQGRLEFPERFWRVSVPEYEQIKPSRRGKRSFLLFRNYEDAWNFLELRYKGNDPSLHWVEAADLAQHAEGRSFLTKIRDVLMRNPEARKFSIEVPDKSIYEKILVNQVKPRPSSPQPSSWMSGLDKSRFTHSVIPTEIKEPKFNFEMPGEQTGERVRVNTVNDFRLSKVLKDFPELEAVIDRELLIEPNKIAEPLDAHFDQQSQETAKKALQETGETELRQETLQELERFKRETVANKKLTDACIEEAERTFNNQTRETRQKVVRGRGLRDLQRSGLKKVPEKLSHKFHKGVGFLFMSVAFWDIAWTLAEKGLAPAAKDAAWFLGICLILAVLSEMGGIWATIATGFTWVVTPIFIWDLWNRINRQINIMATGWESIESFDRAIVLENEPYPMRDSAGEVVRYIHVGFRDYTGSPAYRLGKDDWFRKFQSEPELLLAIAEYERNLNLAFGGAYNVPPKYNPIENHKLHMSLIVGEWQRLYKQEIDKIKAEFEKWRTEVLSKEGNLRYDVPDEMELDPMAGILAVKLDPELPTKDDKEVKVKTSYVVVAPPGEKVDVVLKSGLVNNNNPGARKELTRKEHLEYGLGIGYQVKLVRDHVFALSGPGDYELTVSLHLQPKGEDPKPKKLKFWIQGEQPQIQTQWVEVDSFSVPLTSPRTEITSSHVCEKNKLYEIELRGVVSIWEDTIEGIDAIWVYDTTRTVRGGQLDRSYLVMFSPKDSSDGTFPGGLANVDAFTRKYKWSREGKVNPGHTYRFRYTGQGEPLTFYLDPGSLMFKHRVRNPEKVFKGAITVKLYRKNM